MLSSFVLCYNLHNQLIELQPFYPKSSWIGYMYYAA